LDEGGGTDQQGTVLSVPVTGSFCTLFVVTELCPGGGNDIRPTVNWPYPEKTLIFTEKHSPALKVNIPGVLGCLSSGRRGLEPNLKADCGRDALKSAATFFCCDQSGIEFAVIFQAPVSSTDI
jgi:hypothetical protein